MMMMCRFLSFLLMILTLVSSAASAATDPLTRAEKWFNDIDTLTARFVQISDDGSSAEGDFYLKRPWRSRFDYDDPDEIVLITTRIWLHVDEADQKKVTSYPIDETPLGVIFAENVQLNRDDIITTAQSRDGITKITLETPTGNGAGKLVIEFSEEPYELRRWRVTDSAGITTAVTLHNIRKGGEISPRLFVPTNYDR